MKGFKMIFSKRSLFTAACLSAVALLGGNMFALEKNTPVPVAPENPSAAAPVVEQVKDAAEKPQVPEAAPEKTPAQLLEEELKALGEATEKLAAERAKIEAELALASAERDRELLPKQLEKMRLDAANAQRATMLTAKLAEIDSERAKLERELALANGRGNAKLREKQLQVTALEAVSRELQMDLAALNTKFSAPKAMLAKKQELSKVALSAPKYLKEPLVDGTLYISDRRIDFNGPVTPELATWVCDQINFYNNRDIEFPIFIVIDNSPGGSVLAGYQIQKAMQSSRAPVYVVVKGMAASMAAVIATTAERSYCFENTKVLHHQISTGFRRSNLTVLREGMENAEHVYKMFIGPVAKKLGVSIEEFTKQMYENNSEGDWQLFGTEAVKNRWIDYLVDRVDETATVSLAGNEMLPPGGGMPPRPLSEKTDATGKRYAELPVLMNPFDCWWLSDSAGYYRAR